MPLRTRSRRFSQVFEWLTAGSLALLLLLVVGFLGLIAANGLSYFWPRALVEFELSNGTRLLGEIHDEDTSPSGVQRLRLRVGNRDLTGLDFSWLDTDDLVKRSTPTDAVLLERLEWGPFYGRFVEIRRGDQVLADRPETIRTTFDDLHRQKLEQIDEIHALERGEIGDVNHALEKVRLAERRLDLKDLGPAELERREAELSTQRAELEGRFDGLVDRLDLLREQLLADTVVMATAGGRQKSIPIAHVVRAVEPNSLSFAGRVALFASRGWEFVSAEPRESNTEGGIFPAIFGTVMMVFLMSIAVLPFGVIAAVYLREYAKDGPFVRLVRIAVNNLAGVPSIVFGVFGLGFFVYLAGGSIDALFYPEALPSPTFGTGGILWGSLTLALLTVPVVIVATEEGLASVPRAFREGSRAVGATHFETLWRVVIPASAPGILTGAVLAMARAAGEVAPLMIVGMVKLAPALPVDHHFPFVHLERKFMHLGFHIYDVGFQSPNVEAAKPLVFATALLLIALVFTLNLTAIVIRDRLRNRYRTQGV
jgi:phosphate transport system permease protein